MRSLAKTGAILGVTLAAAAAISFSGARNHTPQSTEASSHREAPNVSQDPSIDATDFYMFVPQDAQNTVTFIVNSWPFEDPGGGPNFFLFATDAVYSINIDNDGDAVADIVYNFRFRTAIQDQETFLYNVGPISSLTDPNFNLRQFYSVERVNTKTQTREMLGQDIPVPPAFVGRKSTPNYEALATAAIKDLGGGNKAFAGQRDDPFFIDLGQTFDLLSIRPGPPGNMGGGVDSLAGYNVNTIALQVNKDQVTAGDPVIGAWTTTTRTSASVAASTPGAVAALGTGSDMKQVSRLGQPLINEVVIPLKLKDAFNTIDPTKDAVALPYVVDPIVPKLLKAIYGVDSPPAPRDDLVTIFLKGIPMLNQPKNVVPSEMLRLNTSIAPTAAENRMGVIGGDNAGFPNGRRLNDDVVDIALRVMAGATPFTPAFNIAPNNQLGDGVDQNDRASMGSFPYVGTPWAGSDAGGIRLIPGMAPAPSPRPTP